MRASRFLLGRNIILGLLIGSGTPLTGCNDESRTSGTQIEISEEAKAHKKSKAESYKGGPAKIKAKSAGTKR